MSKPIWIALDTEDLGNWIDSCPDWLTDNLLEDDEEEVADERFDRAKEFIISHATDGRLANELSEALYDTWLGEQFNDMVWDVVMDFVSEQTKAFKAQENKED